LDQAIDKFGRGVTWGFGIHQTMNKGLAVIDIGRMGDWVKEMRVV
jgi:hypothetical protein